MILHNIIDSHRSQPLKRSEMSHPTGLRKGSAHFFNAVTLSAAFCNAYCLVALGFNGRKAARACTMLATCSFTVATSSPMVATCFAYVSLIS